MSIGFRLVKIADIGYITVLYFLSGLIMARFIDNYLGSFDPEEESKKSDIQIILEIIFYLWVNGITIYILRNIIGFIPSPFHGIYGLKHDILNELKQAPILEFTILYYQIHLTDKLKYLYKKYSSTNKV